MVGIGQALSVRVVDRGKQSQRSRRTRSLLEGSVGEGENPVHEGPMGADARSPSKSRVVWDCSPETGGRLHPRLDTGARPVANKYREGKLKRTLKGEFNSA